MQVGTCRVQKVVFIEPVDLGDQTEPFVDIACERNRHGMIQSDDRRGIAGYERLVEEDDLFSRATLGVRCRDRRLELVRACDSKRSGSLDHANPLVDPPSIPE